jgi:branched-chain amino acid transport system permease protein
VTLLQAAIDGLAASGLYAMLGLGFHLTFGVLRRLDLSFGTVAMVSVYAGAMLAGRWQAPWLAPGIALLLAVPLGLLVALLAFHLVRGDARFTMAGTLGLWMALEELVVQSPGHGRGQPVANPLADQLLALGPLTVRIDHLVLFALALATAAALAWLLHRTRFGHGIRVLAWDPQAAQLIGVSPFATGVAATAVAAGIGCIGGYAFAMSQQAIDVHFGMWATLKGVVILFAGGLAGIRPLLLAAVLLGTGERVATELAGAALRDLVGLGLLLVVLGLAAGRGTPSGARAA